MKKQPYRWLAAETSYQAGWVGIGEIMFYRGAFFILADEKIYEDKQWDFHIPITRTGQTLFINSSDIQRDGKLITSGDYPHLYLDVCDDDTFQWAEKNRGVIGLRVAK